MTRAKQSIGQKRNVTLQNIILGLSALFMALQFDYDEVY
jgi:hypothetical protein